MPRATFSRTAGLAASTSVVLLMAVLVGGCGAPDHSRQPAQKGAAAPRASSSPAQVLHSEQLEAALPNQYNIPWELEFRDRMAWDNADATYCQSQRWPDEWCSEALSYGTASYTNYRDQGLEIRLISFRDSATAARLFKGEGTVDEVGESPPGDDIDGYEVEPSAENPTWSGKGIMVRQGAVLADVQYAWEAGTKVPAGRLLELADVAVRRIQQAQAGKPPTASVR
ncbi:hypothetical protein [Streptomyces sp. NPDC056010]|uniref:hypothetical protein n=1 Tax=Streptomyces sp. NPDC056010 TaxID=3345679 RepID=UPI0035DE91A9